MHSAVENFIVNIMSLHIIAFILFFIIFLKFSHPFKKHARGILIFGLNFSYLIFESNFQAFENFVK